MVFKMVLKVFKSIFQELKTFQDFFYFSHSLFLFYFISGFIMLIDYVHVDVVFSFVVVLFCLSLML